MEKGEGVLGRGEARKESLFLDMFSTQIMFFPDGGMYERDLNVTLKPRQVCTSGAEGLPLSRICMLYINANKVLNIP